VPVATYSRPPSATGEPDAPGIVNTGEQTTGAPAHPVDPALSYANSVPPAVTYTNRPAMVGVSGAPPGLAVHVATPVLRSNARSLPSFDPTTTTSLPTAGDHAASTPVGPVPIAAFHRSPSPPTFAAVIVCSPALSPVRPASKPSPDHSHAVTTNANARPIASSTPA
jgi:hypothetical protein